MGVCLFLSLFAVCRRFSLQPSCHPAVFLLSSLSLLSLLLLSRRSPLPRSAAPPPPVGPLLSRLRKKERKRTSHTRAGSRTDTSPPLQDFAKKRGGRAHRRAERAWHRGSLSHRIRTRRHEGRLGLLFGAPLRIPRSRALSIHLTTHLRGLASGRAAGQGQ